MPIHCPDCSPTSKAPDTTSVRAPSGRSSETQPRACGQCGAGMNRHNKFCTHCGAPREDSCDLCGGAIGKPVEEPAHALASYGGAVLSSSTPVSSTVGIHGECREVTVLCLDVTNFTSASHALDSEDIYLIIDEAMRLLVEVIHRFEGTVDKFTGDGLIALFGAPFAHENDPERAIRAALEMQQVLAPLQREVRREHGFDFKVRIGINTGLVIAGRLGNQRHMQYTVIGDTVDRAIRLESAAEPGTILTSFSTFERTRPLFHFVTTSTGQDAQTGAPIWAYRPLELREMPGRVRGLNGLDVPMFGRSRELVQLHEALLNVETSRRRQTVLISGEAGLGKSRLVTEFGAVLKKNPIPVYQGSGLSYRRAQSFSVLADLLRNVIDVVGTEPIRLQQRMVRTLVNDLRIKEEGTLPYLLALLELPQLCEKSTHHIRLLAHPSLSKRIYLAMRRILMAMTQRPYVLIFEDLHWADAESLEFIEFFLRTSRQAPILLILICRDYERRTVLAPILRVFRPVSPELRDLRLRALTDHESRQLVDQLLPQQGTLSIALKEQIVKRAAGNPFYAEEIVRMLIDRGGLSMDDEAWRTRGSVEEMLLDLPGTLRGLILARFDQLSEDLRRALQQITILGERFTQGQVELAWQQSPELLAGTLDELVERKFLIEIEFGLESGYRFAHSLVQEAVYETLLKRDRRALHRRMVDRLSRVGGRWDGSVSDALAFHRAASNGDRINIGPTLH